MAYYECVGWDHRDGRFAYSERPQLVNEAVHFRLPGRKFVAGQIEILKMRNALKGLRNDDANPVKLQREGVELRKIKRTDRNVADL